MNFDFQSIFSNSIFWIGLVVVAGIIYAAYYLLKNRKKQTDKPPAKTIDEIEVNNKVAAVVLDNITGKYQQTDVDRKIIDDLAQKEPIRILNYENKSVVYLNWYFDEDEHAPKYRTVASVERAIPVFVTPSELYQDQNQTEVAIAVKKLAESDNKGIMDQILPYMPYLIALALIAFLWAMA